MDGSPPENGRVYQNTRQVVQIDGTNVLRSHFGPRFGFHTVLVLAG